MYTSLYRSYRPKDFSGVYGQEHITTTLKNEITSEKLSHAYLFTGSHGTGKTSCAKILAKAVNCLNNNMGEPCNACEICKGLDDGSIFDVVEIDAASNNGVDYIRELREQINYLPATTKYRFYIIDEVHMLSIGAFNALLKTLEEPPAHVIFVLATTETHKIPATILSRCQRFDFLRITPQIIVELVQNVCKAEGVTISYDAAFLIARLSDGAARDALSTLEQCVAKSQEVDLTLVEEVAGIIGDDYLQKFAKSIHEKNLADCLELAADLYRHSKDCVIIITELIRFFRNILVYSLTKNLSDCSDTEKATYEKLAAEYSKSELMAAMQMLEHAFLSIGKTGTTNRLKLEMSLIKLCSYSDNYAGDFSSLSARIDDLERKINNTIHTDYAPQPVPPQLKATMEMEFVHETNFAPEAKPEEVTATNISAIKTVDRTEIETVDRTEIETVVEAAAKTETETGVKAEDEPRSEMNIVQAKAEPNERLFAQWPDVLQALKNENRLMYAVLNQSSAYVSGNYLLIDVKNDQFKELIKNARHKDSIKNAVTAASGVKYNLGPYVVAENAENPGNEVASQDTLDKFEEKLKALNIPEIKV